MEGMTEGGSEAAPLKPTPTSRSKATTSRPIFDYVLKAGTGNLFRVPVSAVIIPVAEGFQLTTPLSLQALGNFDSTFQTQLSQRARVSSRLQVKVGAAASASKVHVVSAAFPAEEVGKRFTPEAAQALEYAVLVTVPRPPSGGDPHTYRQEAAAILREVRELVVEALRICGNLCVQSIAFPLLLTSGLALEAVGTVMLATLAQELMAERRRRYPMLERVSVLDRKPAVGEMLGSILASLPLRGLPDVLARQLEPSRMTSSSALRADPASPRPDTAAEEKPAIDEEEFVEMLNRPQESRLKYILDGANVACWRSKSVAQFNVHDLAAALATLNRSAPADNETVEGKDSETANVIAQAVVSQTRVEKDDEEGRALRDMRSKGWLIVSPARYDDDQAVITLSNQRGCQVVTNDNYDKYVKRYWNKRLGHLWRTKKIINYCLEESGDGVTFSLLS